MSVIASERFETSRRTPQRLQGTDLQWDRVTPWSDAPQWLMPALQALVRLAGLANNWDGYGSPPLGLTALRAAHRLVLDTLEQLPLPAPQVSPVTGAASALPGNWILGS